MFKDVNWLESRLNYPHNSVLSYNSEKFPVEFSKINILRRKKIKLIVFIPISPFLACRKVFNLSAFAVVSTKPYRNVFPDATTQDTLSSTILRRSVFLTTTLRNVDLRNFLSYRK